LGKPKPVTIKALLDSGGSESLVKESCVKNLRIRNSSKVTKWTTPAGELTTKKSCRAKFIMPELHDNRVIEWNFHVTKSIGAYDMIIGRDMLEDLGIDIRFSDKTVEWDGQDMPFKDASDLESATFHIDEPEAVRESMDREQKINDKCRSRPF